MIPPWEKEDGKCTCIEGEKIEGGNWDSCGGETIKLVLSTYLFSFITVKIDR